MSSKLEAVVRKHNQRILEKQVGANIQWYREHRGWTRRQLAERMAKAGGGQPVYDTVARLERCDRSPNLATLCLVADALCVEVGALLAHEHGQHFFPWKA